MLKLKLNDGFRNKVLESDDTFLTINGKYRVYANI